MAARIALESYVVGLNTAKPRLLSSKVVPDAGALQLEDRPPSGLDLADRVDHVELFYSSKLESQRVSLIVWSIERFKLYMHMSSTTMS